MLLRALRAAAVAALASWGLLVALCVIGWLSTSATTTPLSSAVGVGSLAWSMAHLGPVTDGAVTISVIPLGLVLLPLAVIAWCARGLVADLDDDRSPRIDALGGIRRMSAAALGGFVACYGVLGLVVALLGRLVPVHPVWWQTLLGSLAVALVGLVVGTRRALARPGFAPLWRDQLLTLVPLSARRGMAVGLQGAAALLLAGLVPVIGALATHLGQVSAVQRELHPGIVGGALLLLGQLMLVPNLAAWGLSWLAGPGFGIGVDSSFTWTHSSSVLLPNIPILGALPDSGAHSPLWMLAGLVPVGIGAWTAHRALGTVSTLSATRTKVLAVAFAVAVALLGALLALVLSGGALGTRALADVGPRALLSALALLGELGLGAVLLLGWNVLRFNRR